jgi:hypothetical protein
MKPVPLEQKRWYFWLTLLAGLVIAHPILAVAGIPEGFDRNWAQWIVALAVIFACIRLTGWVVWWAVLWLKPELVAVERREAQ